MLLEAFLALFGTLISWRIKRILDGIELNSVLGSSALGSIMVGKIRVRKNF